MVVFLTPTTTLDVVEALKLRDIMKLIAEMGWLKGFHQHSPHVNDINYLQGSCVSILYTLSVHTVKALECDATPHGIIFLRLDQHTS